VKVSFVDSKIEDFLRELDETEKSKILRLIKLLRTLGYHLGPSYSKKVAGSLFELRMSGRTKIRVFYAFRHDEAILLHAFIKKSSKIPKRELDTALYKLKLFDSI